MGIAIAAFCAVFVLIASVGLLIFYRETIQARISSAINPTVKAQKSLKTTILDTREVLEGVVERFEKVVPRSESEVGVVQQRLIRAGFREDGAVKMFYGAKFFTPLTLLLIAWVTGLTNSSPIFVIIACLGFGYLAP